MIKNNKRLIVIAAVILVDALGYGIVIPILYPYSVKYGLTDFQNGILFSLFSICMFISTPIIGMLSDKYGRRPLLISSILGTAGSFFLMAFAPNAFFLFLARALDGLTAGNFPVAQAVISDSTEGKDRAKGFGIVGACFGVGFIAGPAISALTVGISIKLPFIIAGVMSLIAVILAVTLLDETNAHIGKVTNRKIFDFKKLAMALFNKETGRTLLISLLWAFSMGMFIFAFQPFSLKVIHLNERMVSMIFVIFGLIGLFSQLYLVGKVTKKFGVLKAFTGALFFLIFGFLALFMSLTLTQLILACVLMGLANSVVQTLIQTVLSMETPPDRQGEILGINASYMSIGQIFGPLAAGLVAAVAIKYAFLSGAAIILICFFVARKIRLTVEQPHQ
jgi:MFS family permease